MITKIDIDQAYERIRDNIVSTPITHSATLSDLASCHTLLKMENLQMTGAFKERGALNKLLTLTEEEKAKGVIAASAGNHAQGVACHAKRLGITAKIVMPKKTPLVKVTSTRYWGAHVILEGDTFDDAYAHSMELLEKEGLTYIHPFTDPYVIAGQGTIGVEILNDPICKDLDAILIPVGGGGLISGIATCIKSIRPDIRIIGVETESYPSMKASVEAGRVLTLTGVKSLADGIAVKRVGDANFETVQKYVDEIVTVSEDEIANAILLLLEIEKVAVEGAGAVPIAALLNKKVKDIEGKKVLSILSGGNIDVNILSRIIIRGLSFDGRIAKLKTRLQDIPGALEEILHIFNEVDANVLELVHHHFSSTAPIGYVNITFTLETKSLSHIKEIGQVLESKDYKIAWEN